jgi:hypothetical protein
MDRDLALPRDMPFDPEPLPVLLEEDARRILGVAPSDFRALCASGRLVPVSSENGARHFSREDVARVRRLLDRARRLASARRVHETALASRGRVWTAHLRHEASLLRSPDRNGGMKGDHEILARALEAAARVIESAID